MSPTKCYAFKFRHGGFRPRFTVDKGWPAITITDNAIIPLKERVVDDFYDPFGRLLEKLRPRD